MIDASREIFPLQQLVNLSYLLTIPLYFSVLDIWAGLKKCSNSLKTSSVIVV